MIKARLFFMSALMTLMVVGTAAAQGEGGGNSWVFPNLSIYAVAIAAFGGALGDGKAIAAACEGTARNPGAGGRIFTMLLLGLALIETLVLFTFLTLFIETGIKK
ncbi:MAG: ATP synthase F0 subunit C [Blastocatellia bacterium]|nr:ATP synthase F0 subunit C [Blastocatellia bacterium]